MRLTKKLEAEVTKVYDTWLHSYLNGDVKTYDLYLDKDYHFIGSTDNENFLTRKETTKFFKSTAEQLAGKCQIKNNIRIIEKFDELIFITERFDANFLIEKKWVYYGKFRFSSVMHKKAEGWRFIYQHFSMPDSKAQDGETLGAEQVSKENQELRDAIKRRTAELEIKNRELEIETSLEKVRAIAMSMKQPADMLAVCKTISQQLLSLGVKEIRNVQTAIMYEQHGTYMNYEYYTKHNKTFITETFYTDHKIARNFAAKMLKGKGEFYITHFEGKKVKEWFDYQKKTNVFIDKYLNTAPSLSYYWYSLGPVALGVSTYLPLTKEQEILFKRFLNVFELAYRRYLDIELAIEQAKEARIETALERVRAVAMAMHKPDDLSDISKTIFTELQSLGYENLRNTEIVINDDEIKSLTTYHYSEYGKDEVIEIDYTTNPIVKKWAKDLKKTDNVFVPVTIPEKKMKDWNKYRKELGYKTDPKMARAKTVHYYSYAIGQGGLSVSSWQTVTDEQIKILERFRNVFNLSYQRYIDIAKAEAQTREAQIEVALERVRNQSMLMQHSQEIQDLSKIFHEQLLELQIPSEFSYIWLPEEKKGEHMFWATWTEYTKGNISTLSKSIIYPLDKKEKYTAACFKAWKSKTPVHINKIPAKETVQFFDTWKELLSGASKLKARYFKDGLFYAESYMKYGCFGINVRRTLTPEEQDILFRFTIEFERAYTRFLDLQKAEAQVREAQIEASLERVRSRSLAMHKTSELQEVIHTVHEELLNLNIAINGGSFIAINSDIETTLRCWGAGGTADTTEEVNIPLYKKPFCTNLINKIKKGPGFFTEAFTQKEKKDFFTFLFKHEPWRKLKVKQKNETLASPGGYTRSCFVSTHTSIFIINHFGEVFSAADNDILKRFGKVFEQCYTRFLDLQKAEAQTREAQIEASLERVRAQSMAMNKSEDLAKTVSVIFNELEKLDLKTMRCGIGIIKPETRTVDVWTTVLTDDGYEVNVSGNESMDIHPVLQGAFAAWEKQEDFSYLFNAKDLALYHKALKDANFKLPDSAKGENICQYYHCSSFPAGGFYAFHETPFADETILVMRRFTDAFYHAYKRFQDLQRAEAQAREAEIELALERVRARTMAMQHSDELKETAELMFEQIKGLNIELWSCGFSLWYDDDSYFIGYNPGPEGKMGIPLKIPLKEDLFFKTIRKAKRRGDEFLVFESKGKSLVKTYRYMDTLPVVGETMRGFVEAGYPLPTYQVTHCGFFSNGHLMFITQVPNSEAVEIFKRFTKVFNQTYTRFLDLQKAEAQTREAQIELALERVRARTMAMQKSDELADAAQILYQEFGTLGINSFSCGYVFIDEEKKTQTGWVVLPDGVLLPNFIVFPLAGDHVLDSRYKDWKEKKPLHTYEIQGEVNKKHHRFLSNHVPPFVVKDVFSKMPDRIVFHCANFSDGYLLILATEFFSPQDQQTIIRFAKVFEMTYTRFLDLQKAEAQTREAQIEAALEKVRSTSLAMHKSDELKDVILEVLKKLQDLGIAMENRATAIFTYEKKSKDYYQWVASPEYKTIISFLTPYIDHPVQNDIWNARQSGTDFYVKSYTVQEKNTLFKYFFEHTVLKSIMPEEDKKKALGFKYYDVAIAFEKNSAIILVSHSGIPLTEGENAILKRFAKVFEQSYTRFLDLQKAEASAREAQIEAAVERVRAEAMAMHSTSDFEKVVKQLLQQIQHLNLEGFTGAQIILIDEKEFLTTWDFSSPGNISDPKSQTMRYEAQRFPILGLEVLNKWKEGHPYFVLDFDLEKLRAAVLEWEEIDVSITKTLKKAISTGQLTHQWDACGRLYNGLIAFDMIKPPDDDVRNITIKMAHAFEQAYIRFLDLQKAEASAREAQIEAALEKVRSRSLAMHTSNELNEVVTLLFEKLKELGITATAAAINIFVEGTDDMIAYVCGENKNRLVLSQYRLAYFDNPIANDLWNANKKGLDFFVGNYNKKETKSFYKNVFVLPELQDMPNDVKQMIMQSEQYTISMALAKNSNLTINDFKGIQLSETEISIIKRFAKVFDQAYTRFLDLQKAEASAREAQIENALEKVRSRSLAMHQSNEMQEVIKVVIEQFTTLGFNLDLANFNYIIKSKDWSMWLATPEYAYAEIIHLPYIKHPLFDRPIETAKNGLDFMSDILTLEEKDTAMKHMYDTTIMNEYDSPKRKKYAFKGKGFARSTVIMKYVTLTISNFDAVPYTEEQNFILRRFANVFEQAYTRFLDLQKAEASAREATIEMALEKVRSRSMGMQKSAELKEVIQVVYDEFVQLKINVEHTGFIIDYKTNDDMHIWLADRHKVPAEITIPYFDSPHWNSFVAAKENACLPDRQGKEFFANLLSFKEKNKFYTDLFELIPGLQEGIKEYYLSCKALAISTVLIDNVGLYIENFAGAVYTDDENKILMRFGKVFQQTYTRFLDLQRAEELAREGQIELGLERVRAGAMAMQNTDELKEVIRTVYAELTKLNLSLDRSLIWIMNDEDNSTKLWMAGAEGIPVSFYVPYHEHPPYLSFVKGWKERNTKWEFDLGGKIKKDWDKFVFANTEMKHLPEPVKKGMQASERIIMAGSFQKFGCLQTAGPAPLTEKQYEVLNRFAKVFDSTYTRFNDLQKAEASAREATIEASLERVRSRSMAMHKSDELREAGDLLCTEIKKLGIETITSGYVIMDDEENIGWNYAPNPHTGKIMEVAVGVPHNDTEIMRSVKAAWKKQEPVFVVEMNEAETIAHQTFIAEQSINFPINAEQLIAASPPKLKLHNFSFKEGYLIIVGGTRLTDEQEAMMLRFTKVFQQTYRRFLDLQRAEAQAKEATIEAALEKVRSRSLAMHTANELGDVVVVIVEKLKDLGVVLDANGVVLCTYFPDSKDVLHWMASPDFSIAGSYLLPYFDHPIFNDAWNSKIAGDEYFSKAFSVEEKNSFFAYAFEHSDYRNFPDEFKQWIFQNDKHSLSFAWQKNSAILIPSHTGIVPAEADKAILIRFAKVFEQSYVRFMDLQKAEAQAREAKIEMALEKIRSRTMAMQHSDELPEAANLLFLEVQALGIPAWSAGYNILADDKKSCSCIMSSEGILQQPFKLHLTGENSFKEMYEFLISEENFMVQELGGKELEQHYGYMKSFPELKDTFQHIIDSGLSLPTYQINHLIKYTQGFLLFITYEKVPDAHDIFKRFTKVFEQTYTRFLDLKKAEAHAVKAEQDLIAIKNARQKAEEALSNLQATQTQLVQSEKMASLGELTAGIAHEIQNPLNFVNNFSEVSKELLDEIKEELAKGNLEDAMEIMNDVIQNLEKINHHGKRADGIVKGMLQHSRSSSGTKEPTDINALADEYLRLAYHGLRAKDKSFNATMKTDFDKSLEKVNIIPQDIGRVILNLITNAFYVVDEKKKSGVNGYEPTVTVRSKKVGDKVEVSVTDNGNGIPPKVLDKIFQPFFTTKPTGKGTGLGLSLAFDIVTKGHGGELKVKTKEGEGSEFIILLPV